MNIKTINLTGSEAAVKVGGGNSEIKNNGTETIYASAASGIVAGADGVVSIPAGASVTVTDTRGTVYILGNGSVEVVGKDFVAPVFKSAAAAGGEDTVAREEIEEHANNADIHVTTAEKTTWNGKADGTHTHDDRYYTESEVDEMLAEKIGSTEKGAAGGVASLGDDGKVPSEQLPESGGVGHNTTGTEYTIDGKTHTAADGAEIFNDYTNNMALGEYSHAEGSGTIAYGIYSHAEGINTKAYGDYAHAEGNRAKASGMNSHAEIGATASGSYSHAEGYGIAYGSYSHAEGSGTKATGNASHAEGYYTKSLNYASHACGKRNKEMTDGASESANVGDVFVIGNGTGTTALSNAFRVTYEGAVYGLSAFNSSGADYAEFIKPWADGNPDNEDRVGYLVTIKEGLLHKANEGDYIVGITSGNPSIVGNADEDYYWRYERDEFNRFVYEDAEEEVEQLGEDGNPVLDENGEIVMVKTGNIVKNAHYKLAADYDPAKQADYIERKLRPEWSYVGMIGVIPVRDDGTCVAGGFAKCGADGVATNADTRGFDSFFVIERISDSVVSVEMR